MADEKSNCSTHNETEHHGDCHKHHHGHDEHQHHGCGCGHQHHHGGGTHTLRWGALSLLLLASGIALDQTETPWFRNDGIRLAWFVASFLPVGLPVVREAWKAILKREYFSEFTLMLIASVGAFCIGEYPEAVAVMLLYTVGETLQEKAVGRATRDINSLLDVRPSHATVLRRGKWTVVPPQEVDVGETIEVKPGERVPLDGTNTGGEALFDTSALTGESAPHSIPNGGSILAGMVCCNRAAKISVARPFDQSELSRMLELVRDSAARKAPTELFIRRFARIYTPCVIALAALTVVLPALVGTVVPAFDYHFAEWLHRGLVFLVIACPCALVISVPLGYYGGIGAASRLGILFKGSNHLDGITEVNAVAFDKTGTLTKGEFRMGELQSSGSIGKGELLGILLAAEAISTHPIAKAIVRYAQEQGGVPALLTDIQEAAGNGIVCNWSGRPVLLGNLRLMRKHGVALPQPLNENIGTLVVCAIDGTYAGHMLLADMLKEDAKLAVERLRLSGIDDIRLLSGDKRELVEHFARELGIGNAVGELLPQEKVRYIETLTKEEGKRVAFVGDGMNDAPVLALSHVGIAMGGLGSDAAIESADIILQTDQPSKLATAIEIAKATRRIVKQNIAGSVGIKIAVMLLGALGFASLWAAVFADVGVALLAVLNSLRINYMKFEPK